MKFVLPQLYDIRPRKQSGELDVERMKRLASTIDLRTAKPATPSQAFRAYSRADQRFFVGRFISHKQNIPQFIESEDPSESERLAVRSFIPSVHQSRSAPSYPQVITRSVSHHGSARPPDVFESGQDDALSFLFQAQEPIAISQTASKAQRMARPFLVVIIAAALAVPFFAAWRSSIELQRSLLLSVGDAVGKIRVATAAMTELDADRAGSAFADAAQDFRRAQGDLSSVGFGILSMLADLPLSSQLTTGKAILQSGEAIAEAGEHLVSAVLSLRLFTPEALLRVVTAGGEKDAVYDFASFSVQAYEGFEEHLREAGRLLAVAAETFNDVDPLSLPDSYRQAAIEAKRVLPMIHESVKAIEESAGTVSRILGMEGPRRYLVLLQNASELRPTGGFIGNVALFTVANGGIREMRVEDVYLLDGQIVRHTVPPTPIQHISEAWSLHDANWFRDFPTTAKIVGSFFEETGFATPDGVFAVNSRFFERLLAATGGIVTDEGLRVDAATFTDTINAIGESQRPGETTQLQAVASVLPAFLRVLDASDTGVRAGVFRAFQESVASGDIALWFRADDEEGLAERIGADGKLPQTRGDFLSVAHANINGFKTDRVINEAWSHEAYIGPDGSMTDTFTIVRDHRGNERTEEWYRRVNKDYVRVLVPRGAELLEASGFTCGIVAPPRSYAGKEYRTQSDVEAWEASFVFREEQCVFVGEENGRSVFAGWVFVSPGERAELRLTYRLPFRIADSIDSYRLTVVKQPGWEPRFSTTISPSVAWETAWHDDGLVEQDGSFVSKSEFLLQNRFFGVVLKRHED